MPDSNGETRAQRNDRFDQSDLTPEFEAPSIGFYLLEWFDEIRECVRDIVDGSPVPIPWSEYLAWSNLTGRLVRPVEYAILRDMHSAWRRAMADEISEARAREKAKMDIEQGRA